MGVRKEDDQSGPATERVPASCCPPTGALSLEGRLRNVLGGPAADKADSVGRIRMRRLLMAERRQPGNDARPLAGLARREMRGLAKVVASAVLVASTAGARADDWDGCRSNEPDRVIVSCTKVIETPGIDPERLDDALLRRAIGYHNLGQFQRAIRDYDEVIRILPQSNTKYRAITTAPGPISNWASRRKACRIRKRLCSWLQNNLISGPCAAG
jgi:tetratricopeptide (TPR) repeat protein